MKIGFVGLGKMGFNMVTRLRQSDFSIVAHDRSASTLKDIATKTGAETATSVSEMIDKLDSPKIIWLMVPSGDVTENVINDVASHLGKGDIIIDGGNSNFHHTRRRAEMLKERGINFLDAGTSGGVWGLKVGYCMMIGGPKEAFDIVDPAFKCLAPPDGYLHVGPNGAGHYVKMIHNGIEYGMMQAYAEGFEILQASEYDLDLPAISNLWNQGSVIRSWLLELAHLAFTEDPKLDKIKGYVQDSGEGRWTVIEAIDRNVPALTLTYALMHRFQSRQDDSFAAKVLAALRNQFGGHAVKES